MGTSVSPCRQASFDSLEPDAKGRITGSRLKENLKNMEIRAG
jgi:hypothetical protein